MYRPITKLDNKIQLAADANYLYQDLMLHNEVLDDVRKEFGDDEAGDEKVNLYKSMQAVAGLADPVPQKLKDQKVQGLLKHVFGKGSPKFGNYQRRVIGMQTDLAARSAITPNSDLDMDEVGLPEEQAWKIYEPFVIRKMVQRGVKATDASKMLESRDKQAKDALESVIKERPIIITRAPALGKYNMVAVKPKLIKGNSLQTSPIIMGSLVGDFDGDTMSYHVPVSDEAVNDALTKMLPSKNLLHAKDFDAHYIPTQEYAYGLYQASSPKKSGKSHVFRSKEDAIKAYRRGEIGINDEVTIHK
jgi:DNA-directed RNA polymerase subunit beta'